MLFFRMYWLLFSIFVYFSCLLPLPVKSQPKTRGIIDYRIVNWCVTGKDEPELHIWPFNQFVPILRRTHRFISDDKNFRYDLRFYEISTAQFDMGNNGGLFKTVHVILKAEKKRDPKLGIKDKWEPFPLEGLLIQANHNPGAVGLPTGQFFISANDDITCLDCEQKHWARSIPCRKRSKWSIEHPSIMAYHHLMPPFHEVPPGADDDMKIVRKQSEVHANFRWYSPPCTETRRLQFMVLAVRSFQRNEYDLFRRAPYEVYIRDQKFQSDYFPSPYFLHYTEESMCHVKSSTDIQTDHPRKFYDFEMNSKFDCCIKNEENPKSQDLLDQIKETHSYSCVDISKDDRVPLKILRGHESWSCYFPRHIKPCSTLDTERSDFVYSECPPCPTVQTTTAETIQSTVPSIYKRTAHGGVMIMTNFCLQPLVIYIARFYKETFNLFSFKGVKLWYWMHLIGGMMSSGMIYFGYFSGSVTHAGYNNHVILGNVYIITLAFCYLTSWGRHKNSIINLCAEFLHGSLGYVTISLALACVVSAPGVGFHSKLLVYMMVGTQSVFMIIMTAHICILDHTFGMKPRRRHFPTVEARFDEVRVPKGKFRVIMLIVLACLTFLTSLSSTFIE